MSFTTNLHVMYLDIKQQDRIPVQLVRGDAANAFEIYLTDNGSAIDLTGLHVRAVFERSDGVVVYQGEAAEEGDVLRTGVITVTSGDGKLQFILRNGSYRDGDNKMEIQVLDANYQTMITSARATIRARSQILTDLATVSSVEFPILKQLVDALENMDLTVTIVAPTASPTSSLTLSNGAYHLSLEVPRGASINGVSVSGGNLVFSLDNGTTTTLSLATLISGIAMVGATSAADGAAGTVPQPLKATEDYRKLLRGDGTWALASGLRTTSEFNFTDIAYNTDINFDALLAKLGRWFQEISRKLNSGGYGASNEGKFPVVDANGDLALSTLRLPYLEKLARGYEPLYFPVGSSFGSLTVGSTIDNSGIAQNSRPKRCRTGLYIRQGTYISRLAVSLDLSGYSYAIALYDSTGNISTGAGFLGYQDINGESWTTGFTVIDTNATRAVIIFRHIVSDVEQTMTSSDAAAIEAALKVYTTTDKGLSENYVPADAKVTGEKLAVLEDASLFFADFNPGLYIGRITDVGGVDAWSGRIHTYLWSSHMSNTAGRYAVNFNSSTYSMRIAAFGENGALGGVGESGTDFLGFLTSDFVTGVVELPLSCKKFAIMFRKGTSDATMSVATDGDAIRAALSIKVVTDTTLTLTGKPADAKATGDAITAAIATAIAGAGGVPALDASKKSDIVDLVDDWIAAKDGVVYNYDQTRNGLVTKAGAFDENNKLMLCCNVWADLIWGGVDPATFANPSTYDGSIVKAFNWGHLNPYMMRQRADNIAIRSNGAVTGYYGYHDNQGESKSYSYTSYYSGNASLPNGQTFIMSLTASAMACELYNTGYEIPIRAADVGDLVFFSEFPSAVTMDKNVAFRQIGHVAVIVGKTNGWFEFAECGTYYGGGAIARLSIFSDSNPAVARAGHLARRLVMAARHPAAFGVASNVGSKFTAINARY